MENKAKILLIDDDETLLFNLATYLTTNGYEVFPVSTIAHALETLKKHSVDVAVVDYRLARESGVQAIAEIRTVQPIVPIVLMSAYLDEWVETLVKGYKPYRCLRKPFAGQELLDRIKELIVVTA